MNEPADAPTGAGPATGSATVVEAHGDPILSFDEVAKTFPDGTHALDRVSLTVRRGEFVSIVGPSGCGKSTLLRLAAGLDEPTSGSVEVGRGDLGYIFQDATLMPWRTVLSNVELLGELDGLPRHVRRELARDAIQTVGLEGFENHYPKALSGGMRMRVSIARSLTLNPSVFLFDEPFGALDEITRERLNEETLRLFLSERFAGLFITHSIYEAVFLSTRVLVMSPRPGRIVAEFDVPFGYPRPPELRFGADFAELTGAVSGALRGSFPEEGP
ncbi:MAG: ABC transporter ATP-binding protein [Acidimicrobiales bacterium]